MTLLRYAPVVVLRRNAAIAIIYFLIFLLLIIGTLGSERFFSDRNLFNVLRQASYIGVVAVGQLLVILSGGIDLSVGSLVKVCVLFSAIYMGGESNNTVPAIILTIGLGLLVGFIHAFLINRLNVAPFIVTLASYVILRGIALTITTSPIGKASRETLLFYDMRLGPVPVIIILFVVIVIILSFILNRTVFGRYIYAVGGNTEVARLAGIPVSRVRYGIYMLCSGLAALCGLLWLSRMGIGDPVIGDGLELTTITAVILGGASLAGGRGKLVGVIGGVILLSLTANILVALKVNQWIQGLIQGTIIVGAVALFRQDDRA
jgi:ribose transport system permease protein